MLSKRPLRAVYVRGDFPMRLMLPLLIASFVAAPLAAEPAAHKESEQHAQLQGLWQVEEIKNLATGKTQPLSREFHNFTKGHHMVMHAAPGRPVINKSLSDMTVDEIMSQQPVGAGFYSYSVKGGELTRTAKVTLSAYYEGKSFHTKFKVTGDKLTLEDNHSADGQLRRWTLKRIE